MIRLSLFSISYAGFWGQHALSLPAIIAKAAELGYDGVMLAGKRPHLSPLDATQDQIGAIREALDKHHIACHVVAAYTDLTPARAAEVPYLEMQIAYVESLARV
ncbi:MAG: sugar phosphate isomerase/epimerase, partial [Pirellulaceae bacterium]|nr:sugar phosphate isomerase/epimerase [Pirellulaceae bacterium]